MLLESDRGLDQDRVVVLEMWNLTMLVQQRPLCFEIGWFGSFRAGGLDA